MSKYQQKPYTAEEKRKAIEAYSEKIQYSPRYSNEDWEYRHVIIPKQLVRYVPPGVCPEDVWRGLGIRQSPGWEMYMRHEPHVLLFRRPKDYDAVHQPFSQVMGARAVNIAAGGKK
ncbi:uncharacterized protein L201_005969 [Kwoniella dendrophila CBS 6074]|uniref:Cyclin-dependent kinases regulatory subunit n=1 Tax=Kwoniella dendrophila CBS 6074 TaxID=1295534 RepID=A0AAX4K1N5_9TREE